MSENPKQLVELARLSSQQETNDGGMLYSRLADCIECLLRREALVSEHMESLDKILRQLGEIKDGR